MKSSGMKTATSESAHRDDGEADLPRPFERGLIGGVAFLDEAKDIFDHHDRVIDDEADGDRDRHQRKIVEAVVAADTSPANVPASASGTVMLAMNVGQNRRRKRKMTITTSAMLSSSENCTSSTEARMVDGAVADEAGS